MPVDVVGVGLNATDTLIQLQDFPQCGAKVEYDGEVVQPGGQVASAMVACAGWGLRTRYVGKLGDDEAARLHEEAFARAGVEAHLIKVPGAASPRSLILVDRQGERTILGRRDLRVVLQAGEVQRKWVEAARALLVDGHDVTAATAAAQWARAAGIPVVADLDDVYAGVEDLLHCVDYLIVSRDMPLRLTQTQDLPTALQRMQERYGTQLSAATLGAEGVLGWDGRKFVRAAAYRVAVVDTTGAGDVFHAGFLYGLLQNWEMQKQLDFACAAAALNCMAQGARGGLRPLDDVFALMAAGQR